MTGSMFDHHLRDKPYHQGTAADLTGWHVRLPALQGTPADTLIGQCLSKAQAA